MFWCCIACYHGSWQLEQQVPAKLVAAAAAGRRSSKGAPQQQAARAATLGASARSLSSSAPQVFSTAAPIAVTPAADSTGAATPEDAQQGHPDDPAHGQFDRRIQQLESFDAMEQRIRDLEQRLATHAVRWGVGPLVCLPYLIVAHFSGTGCANTVCLRIWPACSAVQTETAACIA